MLQQLLPAARRETLGEQSEGGRRGGLKMGWTKPLPRRDLCVLIAGRISGDDRMWPKLMSGKRLTNPTYHLVVDFAQMGG
jgi:hypothetical protein